METERAADGQGKTERILSRLRAVSTEPHTGLELMNRETKTWAEAKSRTLNQLSQAGGPKPSFFSQGTSTEPEKQLM